MNKIIYTDVVHRTCKTVLTVTKISNGISWRLGKWCHNCLKEVLDSEIQFLPIAIKKSKKKKSSKTWNTNGYWTWKCGCIRFQDGYELCPIHKKLGYTSLEE